MFCVLTHTGFISFLDFTSLFLLENYHCKSILNVILGAGNLPPPLNLYQIISMLDTFSVIIYFLQWICSIFSPFSQFLICYCCLIAKLTAVFLMSTSIFQEFITLNMWKCLVPKAMDFEPKSMDSNHSWLFRSLLRVSRWPCAFQCSTFNQRLIDQIGEGGPSSFSHKIG